MPRTVKRTVMYSCGAYLMKTRAVTTLLCLSLHMVSFDRSTGKKLLLIQPYSAVQ